ncbi:hypothetical protein [Vreelandella hamiltonii]|uniref:Uncharacterized protein n=1 Tax=Vreelandella hamiltonii TaxID=502829 RepID=A0A8H9I589_9GAMM|nr:hypothetical protein [Halomonas hamiltonii]GGW40715.1 hypothetical protein GCM10007157_34250 [Halomonas hamiltonii]
MEEYAYRVVFAGNYKPMILPTYPKGKSYRDWRAGVNSGFINLTPYFYVNGRCVIFGDHVSGGFYYLRLFIF